MDAPRKKSAELQKKIKSIKRAALGLVFNNSCEPQGPPVELFDETFEEHYLYKDKNVYSSLPPMGGAEEYKQQYIIDEDHNIGEGGSGVVYLGRWLNDNKEVAIKIIDKSKSKLGQR